MLARRTGFNPVQLSGDQGQSPPWAPAGQIRFDLDSIPLMVNSRANYLVALELTFFGTFTSVETADTPGAITSILQEEMYRAFVQNLDMLGAWHGRPISAENWRGAILPVIEYIGSGYQNPCRRAASIPLDTGEAIANVQFRYSFFLPLGHYVGDNPEYQAQLVALYKDAQLFINTPQSATFTDSYGNVAVIGTTNVRCSALCVDDNKVRLAPAQEWIEFRSNAQNGSAQVLLQNLGNATALQGVEPGAGIDTLLAETNVRGQAGSFLLTQVTTVEAPLRNLNQTQHIDPFIQELDGASNQHGRTQEQVVRTAESPNQVVGVTVDASGFPYTANGQNAGNTVDATALALPIIVCDPEMQVTKLQIFEGANYYNRTLSADPSPGAIDRTLVHQFKSWSPEKIEDFRQLVISLNIAQTVLGSKDISPKVALDTASAALNPRNMRFMPIEYEKSAAKP